MAEDVEPELTLAVDSMLPIPLLMESLKALRGAFPLLPASVFTEALGGAEQRLRERRGAASDLHHRALEPVRPRERIPDPRSPCGRWWRPTIRSPLCQSRSRARRSSRMCSSC